MNLQRLLDRWIRGGVVFRVVKSKQDGRTVEHVIWFNYSTNFTRADAEVVRKHNAEIVRLLKLRGVS